MQSSFNKKLKELADKYSLDFLNSFNSRLPSLPYMYGLPKVHKENVPLRPIISTCNSPCYDLSKWLAKQLSPLLGSFSSAHLRHNQDLISFLNEVVTNDKKFISFDVKALFTNVPLGPTLDFLKRKLPLLSDRFNIPVDCLIELIELCLDFSGFQFQDDFYEQIFGLSMGNPLSVVISCFFLEHVELELFPNFTGTKPLFWKRYIDDVLCLLPNNFKLQEFLEFINSIYPTLKFTYEWESFNRIPFLDVMIHNLSSGLKFSVYRKPTNAESYLHFYSFSSTQIKLGLANSLFLRAFRVCSENFLDNEIEHIKSSLTQLAYPIWLLNKALKKAKKTFFRPKQKEEEVSENKERFIVVPYVPILNDVKQPLKVFNTKLVYSYNNKLMTNLVKNKPKNKVPSGVYQIPCTSCPQMYLGETGRSLEDRLKEHKRAIKIYDPDSGVAVHARSQNHNFGFNEAKIIYPCRDTAKRKIIESALIHRYTNRGLCCNLNTHGFSPHNVLLSNQILESVKLQ